MIVDGNSITTLISETFRLDGGAMFGVVPKTLWSQRVSSDGLNRIELCCRILVIEGHGRRVLLDTGCGRKWSDKDHAIYGFEAHSPKLLHELVPGVTDVILSHLHFDHCGGASYYNERGEIVLAYPEAVHHLQRSNWEHAQRPGPREHASYRAASIEVLCGAQLNLISGNDEILPGIRVFPVQGHTHGQQWVLIGEGRNALAFAADLLPSAHHIHVPYIPAYDLQVEQSIAEKQYFLEQALTDQWTVAFYHDPATAAGTIARDRFNRFVLGQKIELPGHAV